MSDDYQAQAAELLTEHAPDGTMNRLWCRCGWEADRAVNGPLRPQHAAHQVEVLTAAGLIPTRTHWGVEGRGVIAHSEEIARYKAPGEKLLTRGATDWKDAP